MNAHAITLVALASLTATASAATADEASPYQAISLEKVEPQQAIEKFGAVCLPGFPDADGFRSALKNSPDPYVRVATADPKKRQLWRTDSVYVNYSFATPGKAEPAVPQCNFDAVAPGAVDREYVAQLIERLIERESKARTRPARTSANGYYSWSWTVKKQPVRLLYIYGPPLKPHQISLSLQVWNGTE
ncbi:hypothetical protein [Sphingomonas cavernae]|uniref:hypothetical protein n=1 Tax=Sphingomonas cavernae TaxID=2320861 RepID=UPI0011C43CAD|nr:hypothetical protein [Sphingomonas cavernae]